tara:strand:+ start:486 stop:1226 length:741 start_codon:yes stop_codon:yes gene_type:complete
MMGGIGNVSSLTLKRLQKRRVTLIDRYERLRADSPNITQSEELDELMELIDEVEEQIRKMDPPPPPPVDAWDLDDPAQRKAALEKYGAQHLNPLPDLPPDTVAMGAMAPTMQALMTHMASGEPPRTGRAHPERPVPPRVPEPAVPLSDEQMERNKQGFKDARKVLNPESTMASIWGAITAALGGAGAGTLPHAQVGQTVMQEMQAMPPEDQAKVAMLLLAGGAAASGVGSPMVPLILGGGAALASQ